MINVKKLTLGSIVYLLPKDKEIVLSGIHEESVNYIDQETGKEKIIPLKDIAGIHLSPRKLNDLGFQKRSITLPNKEVKEDMILELGGNFYAVIDSSEHDYNNRGTWHLIIQDKYFMNIGEAMVSYLHELNSLINLVV